MLSSAVAQEVSEETEMARGEGTFKELAAVDLAGGEFESNDMALQERWLAAVAAVEGMKQVPELR